MIFNSVIVGSGGGGTGATVMAKAIGDTYHYGEGAKVILTPTGLVYSSGYSSAAAATSSSNQNATFKGDGGCLLSRNKATFMSKASGNHGGNNTISYFTVTYDDDLSNMFVTQSFSGENGTFQIADYRDDNIVIASQFKAGYYETNDYQLGYGSIDKTTGTYSSIVSAAQSGERQFMAYAGKHALIRAKGTAIQFADDYTATAFSAGASSHLLIPSKYNNAWYGINNTSVYVWGSSSASYTFSGGNYSTTQTTGVLPLDDDWTYLFWLNNDSKVFDIVRVNRNASAWSLTALPQPSNLIHTVDSRAYSNLSVPDMRCKDYGDYVEIFYMPHKVTSGSQLMCELAHFKFYKSTETLERLPDVLTGAGASWGDTTWCLGVQVNWQDKLVSALVYNLNSASPYISATAYIAKYDSTAGIYKYCAYPYLKENFYNGCMTGVVKENKGVNAIGDWILEVETVEDPEYIFDNTGILYGMEVTINPGI